MDSNAMEPPNCVQSSWHETAAQTASVGNGKMLTSMMGSTLCSKGTNGGTACADAGGTGTGSPNAGDESDTNFLDGLFDRMSGSSDNGSDKDDDQGTGNRNLNTNANPTGVSGSEMNMDMKGTTTASAINQNLNGNGSRTGPQHQQRSSILQQHPHPHHGGSANAVRGTANQQQRTNDATRTMSDVSSLSSSNGNTSPAEIYQHQNQIQHQQQQRTNEAHSRNYAALTTNLLNSTKQQLQQHEQVGAGVTNSKDWNTTMVAPLIPIAPQSQMAIVREPSTKSKPHPSKGKKRRQNMNRSSVSSKPPKTASSSEHNDKEHASISEDEGEQQKRRRDRNNREQERSQRIASQISQLKELLALSNIPFKPDKYSTLVSVYGYVQSLQQRNALIDEEHKKLVDTLTGTNELVTKAQVGPNSVPSSSTVNRFVAPSTNRDDATGNTDGNVLQVIPGPGSRPICEEEEELLQFVRGVDYKSVFSRVNIALCVTRIDGRMIDCNNEFIRISGLTNEELFKAGLRSSLLSSTGNNMASQQQQPELTDQSGKAPLSLFNLIAKEDMQIIFEGMSQMLTATSQVDIKQDSATKLDHWTGYIRRCHTSSRQHLHISLVRKKDGTPCFFNCALLPTKEQAILPHVKVKMMT